VTLTSIGSKASWPGEEILGPTFGLMIYQEQMMQVAQRMAGYSLAEADNLRKATGKKNRELIAKERTKFVAGCDAAGYGAAFGEQMFDVIEPFADYSFNKSHSFGYGFVSYQTAYLKAHHPVEYLAALLTSVKDDKDKTAVYLNECRVLGIPVLVPIIGNGSSGGRGHWSNRGRRKRRGYRCWRRSGSGSGSSGSDPGQKHRCSRRIAADVSSGATIAGGRPGLYK